MMSTRAYADFLLAVAVTATGAALSWTLAGGLPLVGIDDAAITRSYAENLAHGAGYVYNIGGERVEGSTTILWVAILTVIYSLTPTPEIIIIALCGLFTITAIFFALRLVRLTCVALSCSPAPSIWIMVVFLLASPGYFMWSVWTMMEVALWSMLLTGTVLMLVQITEGSAGRGTALGLCFAAVLLPLARPEGIALAIGLIVLTALLTPHFRRLAGAAASCAIVSFLLVTGFRLLYFGQPFPNTFYAKVSSDRLQDLEDGAKYLLGFVLGNPFAEIFVVLWLCLAIWAITGLRSSRSGARGLLIIAAASFGMLSVYGILGGDHFVLWRFYQPALPVLLMSISIAGALALNGLQLRSRQLSYRAWPLVTLAGLAGILLVGWSQFYQSRFDIRKEFRLVERGLGFGNFLNSIDPRPTIGVGPAGGIALAYDGQILDLLGLNWTDMAHANPVKVGMRNHASFDAATFWKNAPDVVSAFNRACDIGAPLSFWETDDAGFGGLFSEPKFQEAYVPISFHSGESCWPAFAKPAWIDQLTDMSGLDVFDWRSLTVLR